MNAVSQAADFASGKGHRDENFPVASRFIKPAYRAPILAFYRFARAADDIADHPQAAAAAKLDQLEVMRASLTGECDDEPIAVALRQLIGERDLDVQHPLDLLEAFRRDVIKLRYESWDELLDYCRYSASPVGRFVLDVHGEDHGLWPANDALCTALQVINHLQDCGSDYRALRRSYLPRDLMDAAGAKIEDLAAGVATAPLRAVIDDLAAKSDALLDRSAWFAGGIRDRRLGVEVAIIQRLARSLVVRLRHRDPLADRVHHRKGEALFLAAGAALKRLVTGR